METIAQTSLGHQIGTPGTSKPKSPYKTKRALAWRNAMVACVNAGLEQELFSLKPSGSLSPAEGDDEEFAFEFSGIPALGRFRDIGYSELRFRVVLWPTNDCFLGFTTGYSLRDGGVIASGWLERETGAYLQFNGHADVKCKAWALDTAAALDVVPNGFKDHGKFYR